MNSLVINRDGQPVTTSEVIATNTNTQHKNVLELIREYGNQLSELGRVAFETRTLNTAGGPQKRDIAVLNEQQATFVLTLMRNSDVVVKFKLSLVKAFYEMRANVCVVSAPLPDFSNPVLAARAWADEMEGKMLAYQVIAENDQALAIAAPKLEVYDLVCESDETLNMTEAAKVLQMQRDKLKNKLVEHKWFYKRPGSKNWLGHADKVQQGLIVHKLTPYIDEKTGDQKLNEQPRITGKGLVKLAMLLGVHLPLNGQGVAGSLI